MLASAPVLRRLTALAVAGCCLVPVSALASGKDVIADCSAHDGLTRTYTQKEYRDALAHMPTDVKEYSDCADIIHRAQIAAAGASKGDTGGGGGGGGGSSTPPAPATPEETAAAQQQVDQAARDGRADLEIAGDNVRPGSLAYQDFGSVSRLPGPLMAVALLIVGAALGLGAIAVRSRVGQRRPGT